MSFHSISITLVLCSERASAQTVLQTELDIVDPRVSNHFSPEPVDYHNIRNRYARLQIPTRGPTSSPRRQNQPAQVATPIDSGPNTDSPRRSRPARVESKRSDVSLPKELMSQPNQLRAGRIQMPQASHGKHETCNWMPARKFRDINLDTSELILRDIYEQPTYILTISAYLQKTDNDFYPLNKLRPVAQSIVVSEIANDTTHRTTGGRRPLLPLNCSLESANNDIVGLPANQRAPTCAGGSRVNVLVSPDAVSGRPGVREELVMESECGYLVVQTSIKDAILCLHKLSFYQLSSISGLPDDAKIPPRPALHMQSKNLVFESQQDEKEPLLCIPESVRYICENRVVLKSNSSTIRLVIDRFELMRWSRAPLMWFGADNGSSPVRGQLLDETSTQSQMGQEIRPVVRCPNLKGLATSTTSSGHVMQEPPYNGFSSSQPQSDVHEIFLAQRSEPASQGRLISSEPQKVLSGSSSITYGPSNYSLASMAALLVVGQLIFGRIMSRHKH